MAELSKKGKRQDRRSLSSRKNLDSFIPRTPPGYRPTKAIRFTLPAPLADKLEAMTKQERDELLRQALLGN